MAYYNPMQQMRGSGQDQMMRMSGGSQGSQGQGAMGMRQSWDKRSSGSSAAGSARDSRGSRGSTEGLRMSAGPEMAGVGIFFQQEPTSGRVYVANIVEGGSADRSGVIRVNDVIVKVDDEDVQGQPLSTLRNLILGKQGTYVVLAFRRMTGTELYYFDVELVRGTPEYFESLKRSQAVQDEKEKLLVQVRQQEQDIQSLRANVNLATSGPATDNEAVMREIAAKDVEVQRLQQILTVERMKKESMGADRSGAESQLVSLRAENSRLNEQLKSISDELESKKTQYQAALTDWQSTKQRLQAQLQEELSAGAVKSAGGARELEEENSRIRQSLAARDARDKEMKKQLMVGSTALEEILRTNDATTKLIQEILPSLDGMHTQLFAMDSKA